MRIVCLGLICALMIGCKKSGSENSNKCGITGGFSPNYYRVFYKTKDFGGGPVKIDITPQGGSTFHAGDLTSNFPNGGVSCSTTAGVVKAAVTVGVDASYHAYDASHDWRGSIPSSCDANSCETIELK